MIERFSKVRENLNERKNRKKIVENYICSDIAKESREEEFKIEEDSQEIQQSKKELANKRKYEKVSQDYGTSDDSNDQNTSPKIKLFKDNTQENALSRENGQSQQIIYKK